MSEVVTEEAVVLETSNINSNLESNQNKTMMRPTISNQLFQAKFSDIEGVSLGGEKGLSERTIIDRANFQKIPIHLDYVEYNLPKFKEAINYLYPYTHNKQCTMIHDDVFNVIKGHVVNKKGFGFVRGTETGKYNYMWIDLCGRATSNNIEQIVVAMKNNTQQQSLTYATFDITGTHIKNGKGGLLGLLGYDIPTDKITTDEDVRNAIFAKFEEMFKKYRFTTNTRKILDVVYTGGYSSIMITLGFAHNVKRVTKIEENWSRILENNANEGIKAYESFRKTVKGKIHGQKISESRKANSKSKRKVLKALELEKVILIKSAVRTLSFNGWKNADLAEKYNLSKNRVGSFLAWTVGELKKKDKFVNNYFTINANKKWIKEMDERIAKVDKDIAKVI